MATPRRSRPPTLQELLTSQRELAPPRCAHCRDRAAQDHELVERALRVRIRALEIRLAELEAQLS
jgi:hypothetical protein